MYLAFQYMCRQAGVVLGNHQVCIISCKISGSHGDENEDQSLLGYSVV
jgi:hypothetical protein